MKRPDPSGAELRPHRPGRIEVTDHQRMRALSRRKALGWAGMGAGLVLAPGLIDRAGAAPGDVDAAIAYAKANLPNSPPNIIRAAAGEGRLTLTLQQFGDDAYRAMIGKFRERYPFIDVAFTAQSAIPLTGKFSAEIASRRGIGDCFLLSTPHDGDVNAKRGALTRFKISEDAAFPAAAKSSGFWYGWQQEFATTVFRQGALNGEEMRLIRSYQGLTHPRFKGRLGFSNVTNGTAGAQCYYLHNHADPKIWNGLAANNPIVKSSSPPLLDGLLSGEYDVALFMGESTAANAAKSGAPVGFVFTGPAVAGHVASVISAVAPHPNAGRLWQDWALSREGQELWPRVSGAYSARADVKARPWYAGQPWFFKGAAVDIDWADFTTRKGTVITAFNAAFKQR